MSDRQRSTGQSSSANTTIGASPSPSQPSYGTVSGGITECGPRTQMQGLDNNLESLCEHIQGEGWNSRAFSDIVVQAMGSTFYLHRLLLSRSSYFRNMLQGPWKEANARELKLHIDDENVNVEAVTTALAYLYGHHPKLDNGNAFRVLAAASFLDLQELCAFCTDFIISDLWTENFLSYQAFAERQDYGIHGEKVGKACWGYLCRGGAAELREVLPKLSSQTLRKLMTSDELWVHSEEKRFELALSVLLARGVVTEIDSCSVSDESSEIGTCSDIYGLAKDAGQSGSCGEAPENEISQAVRSIVLDMVDSVATSSKEKTDFPCDNEANAEDGNQEDTWKYTHQSREATSTACTSPSWGGRVVGRRLMKAYPSSDWTHNEDWEAFMNIFEGGGIHYCHMLFDDLLEARARLEELGFPCKSVSDGLWLHTLLRQQILSIAADTCKICSLALSSCACKQYVYPPHGRIPTPTYEQDKVAAENQNVPNNASGRVHVRGAMDGLAGIGRGNAYAAPGAHWSSSRFMFTRRGNQQLGNEQGVEIPDIPYSDGLNMVVGLSQGISSGNPGQSDQSGGRQEEASASTKANAESLQHLTVGDACQGPSISLDLRTPLQCFPPFRFGVEFEELHRLTDGSKHSPEVFYAGSLWKVSVQAFNEEDPRCRRTLGLFLHRRKADDSGPFRKVSLYIDSREKVTARYQLICPAKRGVMVLGSLTQAGTLLPKAPKGWGWRTAILYDDLVDLLQGNSLRVAAVVQVV